MALATGDLDKDGRRELIIGAPGNNRVYIIKGSASLSGTLNLATTAPARTITAAGIGGVLIAGDITGDGIYDLMVGAPTQNLVFAYAGTDGDDSVDAGHLVLGRQRRRRSGRLDPPPRSRR